MSYPEVKVDPGDEHVGLQPDLVDAGGRQGDGKGDHAHERRCRLAAMRERVLGPQSTQQ